MQRAGVDDTRAAEHLVSADMRVPLEQVIELLGIEELFLQAVIVAVDDGDALAGERKLGVVAEALHAELLRIARKLHAIPVVVAEDEEAGEPGEMIDHR